MSVRRHSGEPQEQTDRKKQTPTPARRKSEVKTFRTEFSFNSMAPEKEDSVNVTSHDGRTSKTKKVQPRKSSKGNAMEADAAQNGSTSSGVRNGTSSGARNGTSSGASTPKRLSVDATSKPEAGVKSRAQRLRKSLIANSMSSLTPLYVSQVLPEEEGHYFTRIRVERLKGPGYLYIISESSSRGVVGELFKIGITNDLKMKLRDLQDGNPRPLIPELLLKVRCMEDVEEHYEDVLRESRCDLHGGHGWYKIKDKDGRNVMRELAAEIQREFDGIEIPPQKFRDYVTYYINFD